MSISIKPKVSCFHDGDNNILCFVCFRCFLCCVFFFFFAFDAFDDDTDRFAAQAIELPCDKDSSMMDWITRVEKKYNYSIGTLSTLSRSNIQSSNQNIKPKRFWTKFTGTYVYVVHHQYPMSLYCNINGCRNWLNKQSIDNNLCDVCHVVYKNQKSWKDGVKNKNITMYCKLQVEISRGKQTELITAKASDKLVEHLLTTYSDDEVKTVLDLVGIVYDYTPYQWSSFCEKVKNPLKIDIILQGSQNNQGFLNLTAHMATETI